MVKIYDKLFFAIVFEKTSSLRNARVSMAISVSKKKRNLKIKQKSLFIKFFEATNI